MLTCKHQVKTCLSKTAISTNSLWMVCKVAYEITKLFTLLHTQIKKCTQYPPFVTKICITICSWTSSDARHQQFSERKVPGKHRAKGNSSIWHTVMPNGGYCVYYNSNIFKIREKNFYEQLTVWCVECLLFSILSHNFMN